MKRLAAVVFVVSLAVFGLAAGSASGQTTDDSTTTTTDPSATTTSQVPDATTSTLATDTTTTTDPSATTTTTATPPVTIPQVALPGEHVTAGTLSVGATFRTETASTCTASGSVAGGEVNIIRGQTGTIGAVYGKATLGSSQAGLVMVGLGPLPLAISAFRTVGTCNQDVVGIGTYSSTAGSATFQSVGYGLFPKDYATKVTVDLTADSTEPTAALNLQSAYDFLTTPRPGQASN